MKTSAITRIVIYSLLTVLLLGILLVGLGIGRLSFVINLHNGEYSTGGSAVSAESIRNIKIEWVSGSVQLQTADTDKIQFSETGYTDADNMLFYSIENNTLTICSQKNFGIQIGNFSSPTKHLTVIVPNDWNCKELEIDAAACDLSITNLKADSVEIDGAAEEMLFQDCQIKKLDIDTAACELEYTGTLTTLDSDGAATKINVKLQNTPGAIDLGGTSVDLTLTLPATSGFRVTMDGLSNHFDSQFSTISQDGAYVCGDGSCRIDVDGLSTNVSVLKMP